MSMTSNSGSIIFSFRVSVLFAYGNILIITCRKRAVKQFIRRWNAGTSAHPYEETKFFSVFYFGAYAKLLIFVSGNAILLTPKANKADGTERIMRFLTAGESHGKYLMGILEGIPANLEIDSTAINAELKRRQAGYGRGGRMQIESDTVEFVAGIRGGITTGAPIGFLIANRDYENWSGIIGAQATRTDERRVTAVRPGHADLAGCIKYAQRDARNILERASARETAVKVVIGAIAKQYLREVGVGVSSRILQVGGVDADAEQAVKDKIDACLAEGDTLGGVLRVSAFGLPVGIGSHIACDKRLEYKLCASLMAIPSVKSVSVGDISAAISGTGSEFHDALYYNKNGKMTRKTNRAGGIEGGMSNGEDIVITLGLKPIPSVPAGIPSVDIETKQNTVSARERGDTCVLPAAGVVAEAISETLGGDHMDEVRARMKLKREAAKL